MPFARCHICERELTATGCPSCSAQPPAGWQPFAMPPLGTFAPIALDERRAFIRELAMRVYVERCQGSLEDSWNWARAFWDAKPSDC